jgi:pimeloyl-ACP methyl ester carboxylesterase
VYCNELIRFPGAGGFQLAARLDRPVSAPRAYALFAHCFTCSKDSLAAFHVSRELAAHGIAVLRFDFTGLGNSSGDFAATNFSSNIADLLAAVDFLREKFSAPQILIGHSLGGTAILAAAPRIPEASAVVTIGAPCQPSHVRSLLGSVRVEIEARGEAEISLAGRKFRIRQQFLDDLAGHDVGASIAGLRKALLVFHSPVDLTVDIGNATQIFGAARHPKSFVSLDDADHLLTRKADCAFVAAMLSSWASRYVADRKPGLL